MLLPGDVSHNLRSILMDNDFDSVSWQHEPDSNTSRPMPSTQNEIKEGRTRIGLNGKRRSSSNTQQAGRNADAVDLAGIADGRLDCTVDTPLKENDGTKDAYVSYLVTTHVCPAVHKCSNLKIETNSIYPRPTSSHSKNPPFQSAAASPTLSFSIKHSAKNILRLPFRRSPISIN